MVLKCAVTVLVPMLNEENYLPEFLQSLALMDYPPGLLEILFLDGMSSDRSVKIVEEFQEQNPAFQIRILANEKITIPNALNMGINSASNEVIVRMDCHAQYRADYITNSVRHLLSQPGAVGVGGVITPVGRSYRAKAIALAISSKLGNGGAKYRAAETVSESDTIWCGCWRRADAIRAGLFNVLQEANEDFAFNQRLQRLGKLYTSPDIVAKQYVRESFGDLFKQYMRYGYWKSVSVKIDRRDFKLRQMVPVLFFSALAFTLSIAGITVIPFSVLLTVYLVALILSVFVIKVGDSKLRVLAVMALVVMHWAWFVGFLKGMLSALPGDSD